MEKARVNMSRIFKCDGKTLFEAIQEGALFKFTGVDMTKAQIDFKVGGKFHLFWKDYGICDGIFKEIVPFEKLVFSWDCTNNENKNENHGSTVTITIKEKAGKSILNLVHDNIEKHLHNDMSLGWDDALSDLRKSFKELVAKIDQNNSGLDLYFKMQKEIKLNRAKVFNHVFNENHLQNYFGLKSSGPLKEGASVSWEWSGLKPFTVQVHQVIENELIKFQWDKAHVCMSFQETSNQNTLVVIEATGWDATQAGLESSYNECDGWMEFLIALKQYSEK